MQLLHAVEQGVWYVFATGNKNHRFDSFEGIEAVKERFYNLF